MYFLFEAPKWISTVGDEVMGTIEKAVRTLSFSLATIIYKLIISLYNLFKTLCTARLLDGTLLKEIGERIGLILGLVMFFSIVFSFVKMMLEPDTLGDKEKGAASIIKKTLIVIVLLGVSNFAFNTLYKVQKIIIRDNIISNLLLPYQIKTEDMENFGAILSEELMSSFYHLENFSEQTEINGDANTDINACRNMITAFRNQIIRQNKFDLGYNCLNTSVKVEVKTGTDIGVEEQEIFLVNYNWALCIIAGGFVAYMLVMYCLKVGVRMIQLMVLEIISPMAIVSYLSPKKDNMFSKWLKIYSATYIDVFIRIAIINFVVFLIATILTTSKEAGFMFWESVGNPTDPTTINFFKVVIILALLTFAKKAPDLIKELMPASASKLGFGASMKDIVGLQKGTKIGAGILGGAAAGAAIGLIGGNGIGGKLGGLAGGFFKGGLSGFKGQGLSKTATGAWKNQKAANEAYARVKANGGSWGGYRIAKMQQSVGLRTAYDQDQSTYNEAKGYNDSFKAAKGEAQSEVLKHSDKYMSAIYDRDGSVKKYSLGELDKMRNNDNYDATTQAFYENEYQLLLKNATEHALSSNGAIEKGSGVVWGTDGNMYDIGASEGGEANVIDINATIEQNMEYVLHSGKASSTGNRAKDAKAANKHFETVIAEHNTSSEVQKNKANAGK